MRHVTRVNLERDLKFSTSQLRLPSDNPESSLLHFRYWSYIYCMPIDTNGEVDISTKIPRALFLLDSGGNEPEPLNLDLKIDFGSLQAPDAGATHSGAPRQRTPLRRSRRSPVSDKRISHLFGRQSESAVHSSARLDDPTEGELYGYS